MDTKLWGKEGSISYSVLKTDKSREKRRLVGDGVSYYMVTESFPAVLAPGTKLLVLA